MSDGTHGHGTTLTGATSGLIGNIMSVAVDGMTRDPIDISTMDSVNKWREFIAGMLDAGEITLDINYDGSAAGIVNALNAALASGALETWTVVFPDTSSFASSGLVTSLGINSPFDDKMTAPVTIKLSGEPTFTDVA